MHAYGQARYRFDAKAKQKPHSHLQVSKVGEICTATYVQQSTAKHCDCCGTTKQHMAAVPPTRWLLAPTCSSRCAFTCGSSALRVSTGSRTCSSMTVGQRYDTRSGQMHCRACESDMAEDMVVGLGAAWERTAAAACCLLLLSPAS
jgi:hypothetical protein